MSSKRAPSAPPQIHGFEYRKLIGSGGFSDVFLYEQQRPRRQVAVKVLLKEWSSDTQRAAFDAEADLMATLSNHPSIVTMYEAGVASDGRPFLAMEYCSRPNLGARYRSERFPVAEALRITIQIAGAVETAHRLGILHRDIKPANILVTQYGHPALTDFGISSTVDAAAGAEGMSIPWSPPESFGDPPMSGIATDVWALAATCYTLLAGRSPFEVPGGSNTSADLVQRIESSSLSRIGRTDVPAALERVLATAMAKSPASRYPTMLAFARALQQVQVELARDVTPIDILDEAGHVQEEEPEEDGTRLRQVVAIDPGGRGPVTTGSGTAALPGRPGFAPAQPASGGQYVDGHRPTGTGAAPASGWDSWSVDPSAGRPGPGAADEATVHRSSASAVPVATVEPSVAETGEPAPTESERRRPLWPLLVGAGVLVAAGLGVWNLTSQADEPTDDPTVATTDDAPLDTLDTIVPGVLDLAGELQGDQVVFTWAAPESMQEGDVFAWTPVTISGQESWTTTDRTTVTVPVDASGQTCIRVNVSRSAKMSPSREPVCVGQGAP